MEYIITPIWVFFDLMSISTFCDAYMPRRRNKKMCAISFGAIWISMSVLTYFVPDGFFKQIISICLTLTLSFVLFKGEWKRHFLCAIVGVIFIGIIDTTIGYGVCALLGISYAELVWKKLLFVIVVTITKLIEILLAYLFRRFHSKKITGTIRNRWLLLTLLFPVSSLLMIVIIFVSFQDKEDLSIGAFIYSCVLSIANIAILYLINIMERRTREEQQLILLNQQMDVQTKSIIALEKSYRDQRKVSHEFMHQLQTVFDLLDRGEQVAAQEFIQRIQGMQRTKMLHINSHHPILDAILNQKYQWAIEEGIEMQLQINDLSTISIATDELVVLFSNLLDNAIEACIRLPTQRIIKCNILCSEELYISIRNTSPPVTIINGIMETTKEPKLEHGFGVNSIRHILIKLQAEFAYHYQDGWFHFVSEIPQSITN